jgi:uncharacterized protein (DUF1810 family)
MSDDKFNLERFVRRQEGDYDRAYQELSEESKRSHWMWWIFPQIIGLGMTSISKEYSIKCIEEARAFLDHPYLGKNLKEICKVLLDTKSNDASYVMGYPDDLKLCSSMTLFIEAEPEEKLFQQVLDKFFNGRKDSRTLDILKSQE